MMVFKCTQEYIIIYINFTLATSTVPVQAHNANSFHESQLEQPVEQGSDENFEPEPDLNESSTSDSKDSSVSNLVEYSLTTHDVNINF